MRRCLNLAADPVVDGPAMVKYVSAQRTGTGQEESLTHGLGVVPSDVFVQVEQLPIHDPTGAVTLFALGTHTATVAKITVLSGAKYRVRAQP